LLEEQAKEDEAFENMIEECLHDKTNS